MPKNAFQKRDVITLTWFFGHRTAKNKDIDLKFCVRVVFCILITYILFFKYLESLDFYRHLFLKNQNCDMGSRSKNIKNPRLPFCRKFNFTPLGVFRLRLFTKLNILAAFKHLSFWTQNSETWRN